MRSYHQREMGNRRVTDKAKERQLKAYYKALDLLMQADIATKEARELLLKTDKSLPRDTLTPAIDNLSDVAGIVLQRSAKHIKPNG